MLDNKLIAKINAFEFDKYHIEKTAKTIKIIYDVVKWLEDGGDGFGEEENPAAKCGKWLTNEDMGILLEYKNHSLEPKTFTHAIVKAVKEYGLTKSVEVYRGLSILEYKRVFKHISQGKTEFSISEAKSTSLSKDVANRFAVNAYHGGSANGGKLITIQNVTNAIDYDTFLKCAYVGYHISGIMSDEDVEIKMSDDTLENSEQEIILAPCTMKLVDKKKLVFVVQ